MGKIGDLGINYVLSLITSALYILGGYFLMDFLFNLEYAWHYENYSDVEIFDLYETFKLSVIVYCISYISNIVLVFYSLKALELKKSIDIFFIINIVITISAGFFLGAGMNYQNSMDYIMTAVFLAPHILSYIGYNDKRTSIKLDEPEN